MNDDKETIEIAVQSLRKGIEKLLKKACARKPHLDGERAQKRASGLVRHIRHLLIQLLEKRQSLKALIEWLQKEWKTRLRHKLSADDNHPPQQAQQILSHVMQILVRCQDGLVLLTSGECRHPVDIQEAATTKFQSRLRTLSERADGYTKLYSGEAYSGYGWDEYANETVGIQARLVEILKPFHKHPWEYLESSNQLLETMLDRQEEAVKNLKQSLSAIKDEMSVDITKQLTKPIIFSTQDKMERLQVIIPARGGRKEQKVSIARLANNFQILGYSVLPNDTLTVARWDKILSLKLEIVADKNTANQKVAHGEKRKRRAILDDSDSSDDEGGKPTASGKRILSKDTKAESTGLSIRVETKKVETETEVSLRAIKEQMGVDNRDLEASRQELEMESLVTDNGVVLSYEEEQVRRLARNLRRVEQRTGIDYDANEVWDAREELRRSYMEQGIWALEESQKATNKLDLALSSFEMAKKITNILMETHEKEVVTGNDRTERARLISRRLLFLLAEASTNVGITLLEKAGSVPAGNKKHAGMAMRELSQIREYLAALQARIHLELGSCTAHSERWIKLKSDGLEGDILDSLACCSLGKAIWLLNQKGAVSSTERIFEEGWSHFRGFDVACRAELMPFLLGIMGSCTENCGTLASLGCSKLESLELNASAEEKGRPFLRVISKALTRQIEIVECFEEFRRTCDPSSHDILTSYQQENNLPSSEASLKLLSETSDWWNRCLEQAKRFQHRQSTDTISRGDISSIDILNRSWLGYTAAPDNKTRSQRLRFASGPRENRSVVFRDNARKSADVDSASEYVGSFETHSQPFRRPESFRKWGDELLHKTIQAEEDLNGLHVSPNMQHLYPTAPPPIPPELLLKYDPITGRKKETACTTELQ